MRAHVAEWWHEGLLVWLLCLISVGAQSSAVSAMRDYKQFMYNMRTPEAEGCLPYFTAICGRNRFVALAGSIAVFVLGSRTSVWMLQILHSQRRRRLMAAHEDTSVAPDSASTSAKRSSSSAGKFHGE